MSTPARRPRPIVSAPPPPDHGLTRLFVAVLTMTLVSLLLIYPGVASLQQSAPSPALAAPPHPLVVHDPLQRIVRPVAWRNVVNVLPRHDHPKRPVTALRAAHAAGPVGRAIQRHRGGVDCAALTGLPPAGPHGDTCRVARAGNPNMSLVALPSVGVATVAHVFCAAGRGLLCQPQWRFHARRGNLTLPEYYWDSMVALGLDPAFGLVLLKHESNLCHAGVARVTNGCANIRCHTPPPGVRGWCYSDPRDDGSYEAFPTARDFLDDFVETLRDYAARGLVLPPSFVHTWAPAGDYNDDAAYAAALIDAGQRLQDWAAPVG